MIQIDAINIVVVVVVVVVVLVTTIKLEPLPLRHDYNDHIDDA